MVFDAPYRDRRTWLIDTVDVSGWKFKVYGMCSNGRELQESTIEAAMKLLRDLDDPKGDRGYGFITLHHGDEAIWLLIDWWQQDILHQRLFRAPIETPTQFGDQLISHELACVWELQVIAHERNAWVKHTMVDPENADFAAYLNDVLNLS